MLDIGELEKKIFSYLKTEYTQNPIIFPYQKFTTPSAKTWVEVHILNFLCLNTRQKDELGTFLLHIGLFSQDINIYVLDEVFHDLALILHRKTIVSTNYGIRFGSVELVKLASSVIQFNQEKDIKYNVLTIPAQTIRRL